MKTIKTSELTGSALDWAVAKCEYDNRRYNYGSPCFNANTKRVYETEGLQQIGVNFAPSTDWKQGGPIIERERITIRTDVRGGKWVAFFDGGVRFSRQTGDTALQAAMRSFVVSRLGNTVEIPEELLNGNN